MIEYLPFLFSFYNAQCFQGGDLEILNSGWGCCWSQYDVQEPKIGYEDSRSLKTILNASKNCILQIYICSFKKKQQSVTLR